MCELCQNPEVDHTCKYNRVSMATYFGKVISSAQEDLRRADECIQQGELTKARLYIRHAHIVHLSDPLRYLKPDLPQLRAAADRIKRKRKEAEVVQILARMKEMEDHSGIFLVEDPTVSLQYCIFYMFILFISISAHFSLFPVYGICVLFLLFYVVFYYLLKILYSCMSSVFPAETSREQKEYIPTKDERKRVKRLAHKRGLEPQSALESYTTARSLFAQTVVDFDFKSVPWRRVDAFVLAASHIMICTTTEQVYFTIATFINACLDEGLSNTTLAMVEALLAEDEVVDQAGTPAPKWLEVLKNSKDNWKLVTQNEGFENLSRILSLCVALGLCDSDKLNFSVSGVKLFSIAALKRHATAPELLDAVFDTVVYFVEGGWRCFEEKSMRPILRGNYDIAELEDLILKCEAYQDYARNGNLEKYCNMTENDYDAMLCTAASAINTQLLIVKNPFVKKLLGAKKEKIMSIKVEFMQSRISGGLRESPYCVGVYGGSSVGKSSLALIIMKSLLSGNGFNHEDDRLCYLNDSDKFMSNWRSYINGVFIDDIGNTKADFVEKAPTERIIQIVNNVKSYAEMAEANMKGKIAIEPKMLVTTKNVKDNGASVYSNEPVSITRREKVIITARVKKEFRIGTFLDEDKVFAHYNGNVPLVPDLWELTLQYSYGIDNVVEGAPAIVAYETIIHDGKDMENVDIFEALRCLTVRSRKHFRNQKQLVDSANDFDAQVTLCPRCKAMTEACVCECRTSLDDKLVFENGVCKTCTLKPCCCDREYEDQSEFTDVVWRTVIGMFLKSCFTSICSTVFPCNVWNALYTPKLFKRREELDSAYLIWTSLIPHSVMTSNFVKSCCDFGCYRPELNIQRGQALTRIIAYVALVLQLYGYIFNLWRYVTVFPLFLFCIFMYGVYIELEKQQIYFHLTTQEGAFKSISTQIRTYHKELLVGGSVLMCIYGIAKRWRSSKIEDHGLLSPSTVSEFLFRDKKNANVEHARRKGYGNFTPHPMPCSGKAVNRTPEQLTDICETNTSHVVIRCKDKNIRTNGFFPCSNVMIIPTHAVPASEAKLEIIRYSYKLPGNVVISHFSPKMCVAIPDSDFTLVYVPNAGSWKDVTDHLPRGDTRDSHFNFLYRDREGEVHRSSGASTYGDTGNSSASFRGHDYMLGIKTEVGMCMAPLISRTPKPVILGFHLGGVSGTPRGRAGELRWDVFHTALAQLKSHNSVVLSASEGDLNPKVMGKPILESTTIHPKSPLHKLSGGVLIKCFGSAPGRSKAYSTVGKLPISESVEKYMELPCQHGKPAFHHGDAYAKSLEHSSHPSEGVPPHQLEWAVTDYLWGDGKNGLIPQLMQFPEELKKVIPLNIVEIASGKDGVRFIDRMVQSTSIGAPFSGPKSNIMFDLDPEDHPDHSAPLGIQQDFVEDYWRCKEVLKRGERVFFCFKACLKDEPTEIGSDKVRVFQAAPFVLQMLIREYLLPPSRLLSLLMKASECAVGVNPYGKEWNALRSIINTFGEDTILAGDYSKYDLRMSAQLILAAFGVYIEIARICNYSQEDLDMMANIATEVAYSLTAYNGDLVLHTGSNPSGHNLTVYINSIVNSLLFRCGACDILGRDEDFRSYCALVVYGDDAKSSVRSDRDAFNHISLSEYLAKYGMVFTMPDKTSTPTKYMHTSECDFLKRKDVWIPELSLYLGALSEKSIAKSLHTALESKAESREEQSCNGLDNALREYFNYGREVYEKRREQITHIVKEHNYETFCREYLLSFDDQLDKWKDKYDRSTVERNPLYQPELAPLPGMEDQAYTASYVNLNVFLILMKAIGKTRTQVDGMIFPNLGFRPHLAFSWERRAIIFDDLDESDFNYLWDNPMMPENKLEALQQFWITYTFKRWGTPKFWCRCHMGCVLIAYHGVSFEPWEAWAYRFYKIPTLPKRFYKVIFLVAVAQAIASLAWEYFYTQTCTYDFVWRLFAVPFCNIIYNHPYFYPLGEHSKWFYRARKVFLYGFPNLYIVYLYMNVFSIFFILYAVLVVDFIV